MAGVSLIRNKLEAYVCSANEALEFKLVRKDDDLKDDDTTFKPEFTHQVFGDNESIFGYKDLRVQMYYSAGSLDTYLGMTYSDKLDPLKFDGVEADDVLTKIAEKLPPGFHTNLNEFVASLPSEKSFKPFGKKLHEVTLTADNNQKRYYEIYKADASSPGFQAHHERLQTFLLWYIDAASYIDVDDDRWMFYFIFEKCAANGVPSWVTVGYATVYHYYAYPNKIRPRISQALILPPFQKQGLGAELLQTIYNEYVGDSSVMDITVEEPSDNFVRLRDFVDSKNCMRLSSFSPDRLHEGFNEKMVQEAQEKLKLNKRQSRRVYEILRLHVTNLANKDQYRLYRLDVKRRLNTPFQKQQSDLAKLQRTLKPEELKATLNCTSREQRIEQLERHYKELESEYRHTLERLATSKLT